ncbi:hypothetical protein ACFOGG_09390 [Brenneria rubrifaciens]
MAHYAGMEKSLSHYGRNDGTTTDCGHSQSVSLNLLEYQKVL